MARTRLINPELFLHEGLSSCSAHARLLFISLWTQVDREGRLRWVPLQVHGQTFPYETDLNVRGLVEELQAAGCVRLYQRGGRTYLLLPGFTRWQRPHRNETPSKCPDPESDSCQWIEPLGTKDSPIQDPGSGSLDPDRTSCSKKFVRDDAGDRPPPALTVPTGDDLIDYLLTEWKGKLGKLGSLEAWSRAASDAHPGVDLLAEAKKARAWELANPAKTKRSVRPFLTRWWGRAQDSGKGVPRGSRPSESDEDRVSRIFGGA